ncbi:MAG: aryl-sulfate sulfotransferase [Dehalococcoidia bacterium]
MAAATTHMRGQRVGLTLHDRERTCPGYVLYTPQYSQGELYLLDMEGNEAHRWVLPYPPGLWTYLLPNGHLFSCGKLDPDPRHPARGGVLQELTWDGQVVWEHHDPGQHHDGRRTERGGAIYLSEERLPEELAQRVRGGVLGTEGDGMQADVLVEVDAQGRRIWEWHAAEHLDAERDVMTFNDTRSGWCHANAIAPLPDDRVLVSFRNLSTVAIIDKASGAFSWRIGSPTLAQQHDPSLLENGNILVFDNGAHRVDSAMPFSRVLEIDPRTNAVVWSYQETPLLDFFSPFIGGARRLPNGNTLITEGSRGRLFQITRSGEVVWEYINPHFADNTRGQCRLGENAIFRASHYLPEQIPAL